MNEASKAWGEGWGEGWLATQQALMKSFFPWAPGKAEASEPQASPMEQQFAEMRESWQASVTKWTEFAKEAHAGALPTPEKLREMFAPVSWSGPGSGVMDAALQRVLEGPRYATLWDLDRKLLELQKLTLQRDKDVAAYQAVVHKAWKLVFERFAKALTTDTQAANGKLSWRGLTDKWLTVANDTLIEVHRSEEFLEAQRRMLRAASDRHLGERKIAEAWCEAGHVPTRSEVDELQRLVVELRREVRALRRNAEAIPTAASIARATGQDSEAGTASKASTAPARPSSARHPRTTAAKRPRA